MSPSGRVAWGNGHTPVVGGRCRRLPRHPCAPIAHRVAARLGRARSTIASLPSTRVTMCGHWWPAQGQTARCRPWGVRPRTGDLLCRDPKPWNALVAPAFPAESLVDGGPGRNHGTAFDHNAQGNGSARGVPRHSHSTLGPRAMPRPSGQRHELLRRSALSHRACGRDPGDGSIERSRR
jgi:hypothetical protein